MKELSKEDIQCIGEKIFKPIQFFAVISLLICFASIFVIIWYDAMIGAKIAISSFIIMIACRYLKKWTVEAIIEEQTKSNFTEPRIGKKSKFQERLAEMQRLRDERN